MTDATTTTTPTVPNNQTVWKRQLRRLTLQSIALPAGSKILTIAEQHGELAVWFRCDRLATPERRSLLLAITDGYVPDDAIYINTLIMHNGHLVLHAFDVTSSGYAGLATS